MCGSQSEGYDQSPGDGNRPIVSVLLPCFNAVAFVDRAIESVRRQEGVAWRLVAVDNASEDGTWERLTRHAEQDDRIRAYRNERNIGPVRNWLRCVQLCETRLAALLFADDWYEPQFLARCTQHMGNPSVGFSYSSVRIHGIGGASAARFRLPLEGLHPVRSYIERLAGIAGEPPPLSPACAVFRREDLLHSLSRTRDHQQGFGVMEHGAGPDVETYLDACEKYPLFAHALGEQVHFQAHSTNLSRRPETTVAYQACIVEWARHSANFSDLVPAFRAQAWIALRGSPHRRRAVGTLGRRDAVALIQLVARRVLARVRRRRPE